MGMTYEQYWDESPFLAVVYRKAYRLKRNIANEEAWIQGLYFYDALAVCMANVFSKRGAKRQNYLDKPIDLYPLTEQEKKRREQIEYDKMQEAMKAMIAKQQRDKKKQKGD